MIVMSVTKDLEKAQVIVKVTGLFQAFRLLRINIARWREAYLESIIKLNQNTPITYPDWSVDPAPSDNGEPQTDTKLREAAIELAHEILADLVPHRTKEENESHIPKLLPFLKQLALSSLKLVQDST